MTYWMQRNKNQVGKKLHFYFGTFQHFNVDIYINKLKRAIINLSPSIQSSIKNVINQLLKYVSMNYDLPVLVFNHAIKKINKPVRTFTKKELHQLTKYLKNNPDIFKIGILLCLITGLRLGEICALRWEDIDFENKILCVKHTVQRIFDKKLGKTRLTETRPKSYYSEREIPVADEIINLLYLHRGAGYFFLGSRPMEPRTYQYKFYLYLKEAGITHMNFHILRHTFATNCIECGIDPKSLSEMLGHADVRITLNRYVHPTMQSKREYINKVVTFFAD